MGEFMTKKLDFVFNTFFDVNKDGNIQRDDFDLAILNICKARGYDTDHAKYDETSSAFLKIWEGLQKQADSDGNNEVDKKEWASLWTKGEMGEEWKRLYMEFMFNLYDADGDGSIDEKEFVMVTMAFGVPREEGIEAYRKMSEGGTKEVTKERYAKLWQEYFTTEDPQAAGNSIFGKQM